MRGTRCLRTACTDGLRSLRRHAQITSSSADHITQDSGATRSGTPALPTRPQRRPGRTAETGTLLVICMTSRLPDHSRRPRTQTVLPRVCRADSPSGTGKHLASSVSRHEADRPCACGAGFRITDRVYHTYHSALAEHLDPVYSVRKHAGFRFHG